MRNICTCQVVAMVIGIAVHQPARQCPGLPADCLCACGRYEIKLWMMMMFVWRSPSSIQRRRRCHAISTRNMVVNERWIGSM